jgi:ATP-dependent DNA ligase
MIDFVDLMDARSICLKSNEQEMEKFWYSDQWIMEPTLQGRRIQCLIDQNGEFKFWGKKKSYTRPNLDNKINHILTNLKDLHLPRNTLLDGYFSFGNNQSLLTQFFQYNSIEDAENLQLEHRRINYYLTDIICNNGKDLSNFSLFDRKKALLTLIPENLEFVKVQDYTYKTKFEIFNKCKDSIQIFIFKDVESIYEYKISSAWKIYKEPETYFMILTGFVDGKNNNQNMVVAFEGSQYKNGALTKIMNIPVNTTDDKVYYYNNKSKFLGKVFEIKAFEKLKNKYQEARFHKIRNDLKEDICLFDSEV